MEDRDEQQSNALFYMIDYLRSHLHDLRCIVGDDEIPWWVEHLSVPGGWLVGRFAGTDGERPWRISASGPQPDSGWDACETLTVAGYTGFISGDAFVCHASDAISAQGGFDINTHTLIAPNAGGAQAVRSSGYITAAGLLIWMQCTYYGIGSVALGQGRLIEQSLMVESSARHQFDSAIEELGESALQAFIKATVNL